MRVSLPVALFATCASMTFSCTDDRLSLGSTLNRAGATGAPAMAGAATTSGGSAAVRVSGEAGEDNGGTRADVPSGDAGTNDGGTENVGGSTSITLAGNGGRDSAGGTAGAGTAVGSAGGATGGSGGNTAGTGGNTAGTGGNTAGTGGNTAGTGGSQIAGAGGGIVAAVCGNGTLEALEKCDDGNQKGADGCGAACQIEAGFACAGAPSLCSKNPSCVGLQRNCGPTHDGDCCASSVVPQGSFYRGNTAVYPTTYPATVSDFRLDIYEVTLGRFRKFVDAYTQNMIADGAGKNPNNSADPGWDANRWNPHLYPDRAALVASFNNPTQLTWTTTPLSPLDETRPIDFVDWFTAEAFCIWDGGRLPTYAEWDYAAAGGAEQRTYPWGNQVGTGTTPAVTICSVSSSGAQNACYVRENIAPVGSAPAGNGKWGQADLVGNLQEWLQDAPSYKSPTAGGYTFGPVPCNDCCYLEQVHPSSDGVENRIFIGGDYGYIPPNPSYFYQDFRADHHSPFFGMRCARTAQ
jgi:cysteine-rich repeat protein